MQLKGKKITVLGARRSGMGAVRLLLKHGIVPFLSDSSPVELTPEQLDLLISSGVSFELGKHSEQVCEADLVVISPGIPGTARIVQELEERKIPLISELELAASFAEAPIIGITGSNGKTTTTAMTSHLLKGSAYYPLTCGNIGYSFSEAVVKVLEEKITNPIYVVEISSFQLERIVNFKPNVAVLLNISPDHLDRYASLEDYIAAKMNILKNLDASSSCVYNADDPELSKRIKGDFRKYPFGFKHHEGEIFSYTGNAIRFTEGIDFPVEKFPLRGSHNLMNALAALTAAYQFESRAEILFERLSQFKAVPHRIEFVRELGGIKFYNDSKATNLDALRVALESFQEGIILVMGGKDKGADFNQLRPLISEKVKLLILIGEATERIYQAYGDLVETIPASNMDEAVKIAYSQAEEGDIVLLSPACASFDMFKNFEERGEYFKTSVWSLEK